MAILTARHSDGRSARLGSFFQDLSWWRVSDPVWLLLCAELRGGSGLDRANLAGQWWQLLWHDLGPRNDGTLFQSMANQQVCDTASLLGLRSAWPVARREQQRARISLPRMLLSDQTLTQGGDDNHWIGKRAVL